MKKKNLKNLKLHVYKISNLELLHGKVGGTVTTMTDTQVDTNPNNFTTEPECPTNILECASLDFLECATNGGTTRTQPPTEYEGCNPNNAIIIF